MQGVTKIPVINRRVITLRDAIETREKTKSVSVLVVNASSKLARELTFELTKALPGCTILFAPTLTMALFTLKRRSVDLLISSSILPDGSLNNLNSYLESLSVRPELLIVGDLESSRAEFDNHPGYRLAELRRINSILSKRNRPENSNDLDKISALGADLRNDLNNPLQEIVAMAFVAHSSSGLSSSAEDALSAIERAAIGMSVVVEKLEEKIRIGLNKG